jgi:hypothetical protein
MLKNLRKEDALAVAPLFWAMQREQGVDPAFEAEAFWFRWGVVDGANALKHAEKFGADRAQVMRGWAQTDLEAARAWLDEHPDDDALEGFVAGYAQRDLDGATRFVLGEKVSSGHPLVTPVRTLMIAARQQRQLAGLIQWYEALPESALKKAAFAGVSSQLAGGQLLTDWVASKATSPERNDGVIASFANSLANGDPEPIKALDWLSKLPPSPTTGRYDGLDRVLPTLVGKNPTAAQQWLARPDLPPALKVQGQAIYDRYAPKIGEEAPAQ